MWPLQVSKQCSWAAEQLSTWVKRSTCCRMWKWMRAGPGIPMSHSHDFKQPLFTYLGTIATVFYFTLQKIVILSSLYQGRQANATSWCIRYIYWRLVRLLEIDKQAWMDFWYWNGTAAENCRRVTWASNVWITACTIQGTTFRRKENRLVLSREIGLFHKQVFK